MRPPALRPARLLALIPLLLAGGCATVGYYTHAVGGQLEILARSRPIDELLDGAPSGDGTPPGAPLTADDKARLALILEMRAFASRELALPDNGSYRSYADLERPYVAWNVIATPELDLIPTEWCFPFAGCVPYRGYFNRQRAQRFAAGLANRGLDVRVAPVAAYSTLGWFRDPILASQLRSDDDTLAAVMFHELAHQALYVPGDAAFNESFATTVEIEGMHRWLTARGSAAAFAGYERERAERAAFVAQVLEYRNRLAAVYASDADDAAKRTAKADILAELRGLGPQWRAQWGEDAAHAPWFAQPLNNAHLASVGLYHQHVPAFQALLAAAQGDLPAFYREARALARLAPAARAARLAGLAAAR